MEKASHVLLSLSRYTGDFCCSVAPHLKNNLLLNDQADADAEPWRRGNDSLPCRTVSSETQPHHPLLSLQAFCYFSQLYQTSSSTADVISCTAAWSKAVWNESDEANVQPEVESVLDTPEGLRRSV